MVLDRTMTLFRSVCRPKSAATWFWQIWSDWIVNVLVCPPFLIMLCSYRFPSARRGRIRAVTHFTNKFGHHHGIFRRSSPLAATGCQPLCNHGIVAFIILVVSYWFTVERIGCIKPWLCLNPIVDSPLQKTDPTTSYKRSVRCNYIQQYTIQCSTAVGDNIWQYLTVSCMIIDIVELSFTRYCHGV